jgi:hypothetical protein
MILILHQTLAKQSLYRSLGLQEFEAPRISRHSVHKGCKVVSPMHRPPLSPGEIPGATFC